MFGYSTKNVTASIRKQKYTSPMKLLLHNELYDHCFMAHITVTPQHALCDKYSDLLWCDAVVPTGKHMNNNTVAHPRTPQSSELML
jgi:hypothetical protein